MAQALERARWRRRRRLWWPSSLRPNPGNRDTLNSWDCRRTLKQRPPARRTRTVSFLSSAALWIWLLKINKNDARSAAFSVSSTSRFLSAGSLIPGAKFNACESGRRMGTRVAGAGSQHGNFNVHPLEGNYTTCLHKLRRFWQPRRDQTKESSRDTSCADLNYLLLCAA